MSLYSDTLNTMRGGVRAYKPNASPEQMRVWINARIRQLIDRRPYWCDLGQSRMLAVPAPYTTGTVSVTTGSKVVTGASTVWPVSDLSNTTIPRAVDRTGYVRVYPAAMTGITTESILYVDAGVTPEAVPVVEVASDSFIGQFSLTHNAGAALTQSSYVNRQFRPSSNYPIFSIRAVHSTTELELDMEWSGDALTAVAYEIFKIYYSLGNDVRKLHDAIDSQWAMPIATNVTQQYINALDPQRMSSASSGTMALVDFRVSENGSMLYELWPRPTAAKQIGILLSRHWPEMMNPDDRPPHFINPQTIVNGAIADALRQKVGPDDPYFNPQLAREFEMKFEQGYAEAAFGDSSRAVKDYQFKKRQMFPLGDSEFNMSHEPALLWL